MSENKYELIIKLACGNLMQNIGTLGFEFASLVKQGVMGRDATVNLIHNWDRLRKGVVRDTHLNEVKSVVEKDASTKDDMDKLIIYCMDCFIDGKRIDQPYMYDIIRPIVERIYTFEEG